MKADKLKSDPLVKSCVHIIIVELNRFAVIKTMGNNGGRGTMGKMGDRQIIHNLILYN
jgi:hypothetical protein